ncbi:MAG: ATP-binding protein [Oscillospiraceae bacterium]|jgi:molecular chaperone HtpG|nr:ATP-binding protein [Oscillospiraceae bacterium]
MAEYTFGANIIENLTTGMYRDSKVIYREYIQNACDQIDQAEKDGILRPRNPNTQKPDLGEGEINIWLESENRKITIEDNATGIRESDFQRILGNIADSDKILGENKGFRGIGRLCGLAYCHKLVFTTRYSDEDIVSVMSCDAKKMRKMINDANTKIQKYTALDVLQATTEFSQRKATSDDKPHFFCVDLIDINEENEELFGGNNSDNQEQIMNYLSFTAPVDYDGNFMYRKEIYEHAKSLGVKIDVYNIKVNGQDIFKRYKTHFKTRNGNDDVFDLEFKEFYDSKNNLMFWLWFGKCSFKAAIDKKELSRGLRLRKENIQIGERETLRDMFTRDGRGNSYFIGEIFCISPDLVPNTQRDYFNEDPVRIDFEHKLKDYFNNELHDVYYEGSDINATIKKVKNYSEKLTEFNKKEEEQSFTSDEEYEREKTALEAQRREVEKAKEKLDKKIENPKSNVVAQIIKRRESEIQNLPITLNTLTTIESPDVNNSTENSEKQPEIYKAKKKYLVDRLFPDKSKAERKLLSGLLDKIFIIIQKSTDAKTSEKIITKIKEELK